MEEQRNENTRVGSSILPLATALGQQLEGLRATGPKACRETCSGAQRLFLVLGGASPALGSAEGTSKANRWCRAGHISAAQAEGSGPITQRFRRTASQLRLVTIYPVLAVSALWRLGPTPCWWPPSWTPTPTRSPRSSAAIATPIPDSRYACSVGVMPTPTRCCSPPSSGRTDGWIVAATPSGSAR